MSSKQTLFLSLATFFTVLSWIAFDVYRAANSPTIGPVQQELIKPLNPQVDTEIILELKGRSQK